MNKPIDAMKLEQYAAMFMMGFVMNEGTAIHPNGAAERER